MLLLPTQTPVVSSDLKTKMASFAFDVFYIYIFLPHKFSFGNYTALYQTILNSINLCLHFLSSVTFKHRHLTFFVFTKILPNNIPCTHLHHMLFLKLSHQPDFTLETFAILFIMHLIIQHQSLLST